MAEGSEELNATATAAARRLARAREAIAARGLRGLLVTHLPNLRYLTGFSGSNGWLLLADDRAVFFTDSRYEQQAGEEIAADAGVELQVPREKLIGELAGRAERDFSGQRIGFEGSSLSYDQWHRLCEEAPAVVWSPTAGIVEGLRSVKDAAEVEAIEAAVGIAVRALRETLSAIRPGMSEADVAAELDYRMTRLGAERPAFDTIVASGPRAALPHATAGTRVLQAGELLLIDFGARWRGYNSDITRTFCLAEPTPRQREVYEAVRHAGQRALAALRAGSPAGGVDAAARGAFQERGLEENFLHSTGHGLGLEIHEGPGLRRGGEEALAAGMVVTVEPGLYFPGWGGVRIENDWLVTEGEPRSLVDLEEGQLRALPF